MKALREIGCVIANPAHWMPVMHTKQSGRNNLSGHGITNGLSRNIYNTTI